MALVSLFGIDKNYDIKTVLKGVDFILNEGRRLLLLDKMVVENLLL